MKTKDNKYGVLLFDDAWEELKEALEPYFQKGKIGKYLYCKEINQKFNFVELTFTPEQVDKRIEDEMTIYIPVRFIKFMASISEKNSSKIGF